jgi:hypothetical protein
MPDQDDLDRLIDTALASYADPGPNSGLERRVLTRINTARASSRRHRRLIWATLLPAAVMASVLLLFVASTSRRAQPHAHPQAGAQLVEKPISSAPFGKLSAAPRAAERSGTRKAAPHAILRASAMPKLDIFPTLVPLSSEERALVSLVAETPVAERQDLTTKWLQADEPIHIADLSIPSINPPAEGKE